MGILVLEGEFYDESESYEVVTEPEIELNSVDYIPLTLLEDDAVDKYHIAVYLVLLGRDKITYQQLEDAINIEPEIIQARLDYLLENKWVTNEGDFYCYTSPLYEQQQPIDDAYRTKVAIPGVNC